MSQNSSDSSSKSESKTDSPTPHRRPKNLSVELHNHLEEPRISTELLVDQSKQRTDTFTKDQTHLNKVVAAIIEGGLDNLQVICDFDKTISHPCSTSSWEVVETYEGFHDRYRRATRQLFAYYYNKEINPNYSRPQKVRYMEEWWDQAHKLLMMEEPTRGDFDAICKLAESDMQFRDDVDKVFELLAEKKVPFLIFSAGVGNVIEGVLRERKLLSENVHVVSNNLQFEGDDKKQHTASPKDKATGWCGSNIHVFNKSEFAIRDKPYFSEVEERKNVILVGDSTGDAEMAEGVPHDNVLRVGFLNTGDGFRNFSKETKKKFMDAFDVVLHNDYSMDFLLDILKKMK